MAVIVKGEITITKGFDHWKSMVFSQKEKMAGMGMQFLFAGTEKNDPTKLHTVIKFESVEAKQAFGAEEAVAKLSRQIPMNKIGDTDDVSFAILYLASDESKFMTGTEIVLDGGLSAM